MVDYVKKHVLLTVGQSDWLARRAAADEHTEAETLRMIIDMERRRDGLRLPLGVDEDGSPAYWDWRAKDLRVDAHAAPLIASLFARILTAGMPLIVFNPTGPADMSLLASDPTLPSPIVHANRTGMRREAEHLTRMLGRRLDDMAMPVPMNEPPRRLFVAYNERDLPEEAHAWLTAAQSRRKAGASFIRIADGHGEDAAYRNSTTRIVTDHSEFAWQRHATLPWAGEPGEDHAWLFDGGTPQRIRIR